MPTRLSFSRLALLLALALCLPLVARADDASRQAKANQLVLMLHSDRMVQQALDGIIKQVSDAAQTVTGPSPSPQNKSRLDDFNKNISQLLDAQLGWKALQSSLTDLYAKSFTEEQLDACIAFYKTPAGIALVQNIPTIDASISDIAHSKLDALQPQLRQLFTDFRNSQTAAVPVPAAAPAPTPAVSPAPASSKSK